MKVDYQNTFIYKLCCRDPNVKDIYIGHSTNFKQRNKSHKCGCNNNNNIKKYNTYNYRFIRENGGYDNWIMIKLYDFPCDSKREAETEENKTMIELGTTLNMRKSFRTEEEKKENSKEYSKKKYENNKKKLIKISTEYYKNNKTEVDKKWKIYYENNKTEINEKRKVKVKCEFCNCEVNKSCLKTHQKTLKCKKFKEFIDVE